jgi:DNA-binding MarR family transcriptional regulator
MPALTPDDPKAPRLADFLCFAIYSANLAYGRAYKPILDELGLTYTQYIAIIALWEEDHQSVGSLGEKLFLESNTLTPILKKLEALGYIRRQRDPADERQVRVSLTPEGRKLREKAFADEPGGGGRARRGFPGGAEGGGQAAQQPAQSGAGAGGERRPLRNRYQAAAPVMVGLVPTIHAFPPEMRRSRRGCSPQGRA